MIGSENSRMEVTPRIYTHRMVSSVVRDVLMERVSVSRTD